MILDHEGDYPSRWSAVVSVADKIGCVPQTLHEWVKRAKIDSGKRAGVPADDAAVRDFEHSHTAGDQDLNGVFLKSCVPPWLGNRSSW